MKNKEFRVLFTIVSLILTLGILLGGYSLYKKFGVQEPVIKQLCSNKAIEKASIEKKNQQHLIKIELKKVENIQKQYAEVENIINSKFEPDDYELIIIGKQNKDLEQLFDQLQPAIYEALASNRYLWLSNEIKRQTDEKHMAYRMFVDERYLYIQIEDGDSYIYKIINRNIETQDIS